MSLRTAFVAAILALVWNCQAIAADYEFTLANGPSSGTLYLYVFDNANAFGEMRDPVRIERFELTGDAEEVYSVGRLAAGNYAILAFFDQNGNGILDRSFAGIPREPLALSNDYHPKGPPNFNRARVYLAESETVRQQLRLERPLGERGQIGVGFGLVAQSSPYRDSDSAQTQPIPAIIYIGERLQVVGPYVSYTLAGSDRVRLAAQGGLRLGAYEEDDSPYLQGLGDRKATFMGGLALATDLPAGVELSVRYVHDLLDRVGGGTAGISLDKGFQVGNWRLSPSVSLEWLDSSLADYEFGVPEDRATAARPAYQLSDAINWGVGVTALYEVTPRWHLIISATREQLDSEISDSPIVDQDYLLRGFGAVSYTF